MKFFIASHSQQKAIELRNLLIKVGHEVVSRWITDDTKFHQGMCAYTEEERKYIAKMDEEDVRMASDGLILLAEDEGKNVPGGKHVETGIAIGLNKPVYVIGRRENIFHWHPNVRVFKNFKAFLNYLNMCAH